ncbi:MAG: cation transporter [Clostridia bacterium]|nr:cation transporter [Clostridia bacterium]
MISLISKMYIKESDSIAEKRNKYGVICSVVGIFLNILLTIIKIVLGVLFNYISMIADGVNNLSDAGSSIVSMIGFKLSKKKPDREHPYGHGRIEYVAGFVVSMIIFLMGFELLKESVIKLSSPVDSSSLNYIVYIMLCFSIAVKLYMFMYNMRVGKKINSDVLKAVAIDSISDCFATFTVILSAALSTQTNINLDAISGIIVSLFIICAGFSTSKEVIGNLIGKSVDKEFKDRVKEIVLEEKAVLGVHDILVHEYGPSSYIVSLHAEVKEEEELVTIHNVIDKIERKLKKELGCIATIHIDPVNLDDEEQIELYSYISEIVKNKIDKDASIHDLRIIESDENKSLCFDISVSYDVKMQDEEVKNIALDILNSTLDNYVFDIDVDRY